MSSFIADARNRDFPVFLRCIAFSVVTFWTIFSSLFLYAAIYAPWHEATLTGILDAVKVLGGLGVVAIVAYVLRDSLVLIILLVVMATVIFKQPGAAIIGALLGMLFDRRQ